MNGFILRLIAMITMLTDHVAFVFLGNPMILRVIGRIAFPVYAMLLAEGFMHIYSKPDRCKKQLATLLILAVVSEPVFDLLEHSLDFAAYMEDQSNIITLLMGFVGMIVTEALFPADDTGRKKPSYCLPALIISYILIAFANFSMRANFNLVGPLLVLMFYWYLRLCRQGEKEGKPWKWTKKILFLLAGFTVYLAVYFWVRSGFGDTARWLQEIRKYSPWIVGHFLAALIVSFYNGELGYHEKWFSKMYT